MSSLCYDPWKGRSGGRKEEESTIKSWYAIIVDPFQDLRCQHVGGGRWLSFFLNLWNKTILLLLFTHHTPLWLKRQFNNHFSYPNPIIKNIKTILQNMESEKKILCLLWKGRMQAFYNKLIIVYYVKDWRRQWKPTPVLFLENPMNGGAW